ncbi:MAG: hypothetical protein V7K48_02090 [Nostoc sp.]|uniref:hypothetical protein n=1 Tax=Nostoc sp. TaxID=1180 RepID=UPI002FF748BB
MSQFESVPQFELSDFEKYQWTEILDKKIPKECQNYSEEFRIKSESPGADRTANGIATGCPVESTAQSPTIRYSY